MIAAGTYQAGAGNQKHRSGYQREAQTFFKQSGKAHDGLLGESEGLDYHQDDDGQQKQHRDFIEPAEKNVTMVILASREAA